MFLKISQNSQENTCARASLLIKLLVWGHPFLQNTYFYRTPLVAAYTSSETIFATVNKLKKNLIVNVSVSNQYCPILSILPNTVQMHWRSDILQLYNFDFLTYFWHNEVINNWRREMFCNKKFLKNFAKSPGKHMCQSLFLNKLFF